MKPERWHEISRIFKSALSVDPDARTAFIRDQCGADESLRKQVEDLVESHRRASAEHFIAANAEQDAAGLMVLEEENARKSVLEDGQVFGSYLILGTLGAGGMGEVYLAKDLRLDRTVALKILPPEVAADQRRMQRFRQEAKVASSLNQPNILTVYEFGEVDARHFLATEYVDGETLRDFARLRQLKLSEILDLSLQILAAIEAAHEASIVHRDIKPENVMIRRRDRIVKVLDFGLAKLTEKTSSSRAESSLEAATQFKTAAGAVMGTVSYMSPEQAQGLPVDERTDIWSAGVMIYEMVAGTLPFKGLTSSHTIVQILEKDPVPLTQLESVTVPAELQRIVSKSMAKSTDERYQSAKEMLIDLRNLKKEVDREAEMQRSTAPDRSAARTDETKVARATAVDSFSAGETARSRSNATILLAFGAATLILIVASIFGMNAWRSRGAKPLAAVSAPTLSAVRQLTYSVTVQKYRDGRPFEAPFQLANEMLFERGYQIRLNVTSPQTGYLYILNEGPHEKDQPPEFVVLFPSSTSNNGSALVTPGRKLVIPETSWFSLDNEKGTEGVWLVFSATAVPELEPVRLFANRVNQGLITDQALRDAVQAFLQTHSGRKPTAERHKERKETTLEVPGDLMLHLINLEHQ